MTRQNQIAKRWTQITSMTDQRQASQPVFFYDGDFRTWEQVERRVLLNRAIAAQLAR